MATELRSNDDVFRLKVKAGKLEANFFDRGRPKDAVPGLALRVRAGGSRKWYFFYRFGGKQCRLILGDAAALDLSAARKIAREHLAKVANHVDPAIEVESKRDAAALTFGRVVGDYLKDRESKMRPNSFVGVTHHLMKHWGPLHPLPLNSVTRKMVASQLRAIERGSGPMASNRARSSLGSFYSWCISQGLCDEDNGDTRPNPVEGTRDVAEEKSRDRVLTDSELVAIWNAAERLSNYGRIVRMLMLTGQRREEIGGLLWSEVGDGVISLPGERTKNGLPHDIPLAPMAAALLPDPVIGYGAVFSGSSSYQHWSGSKAQLDKLCGVVGWRLHDLRRTMATKMADEIGIQPHIIEAVLNHVSGHKRGVAGAYNRAAYATEKRAALEAWAGHLQVAIAKASGANVTKLH